MFLPTCATRPWCAGHRMTMIGIREVWQHASRYLRCVKQGESVTVTERGEPIAELRPQLRRKNTIDRLENEGRITTAGGDLLGLAPMLPSDGYPPLSELLDELRGDQIPWWLSTWALPRS